MKKTFFSLAENIDETIFKNAKESLLKSLDELEKTKNGFWLDIIWKKENKDVNFYTHRHRLIEQLTPSKLKIFLKQFFKTSHICETLMQPEMTHEIKNMKKKH
jgi:hypothetical protein